MNTTTVKRAHNAFRQGDYHTAKQLYQQAANQYGGRFFEVNLTLCERRLQNPAVASAEALQPSEIGSNSSAISQQLAETQKLLEKYFTRCQELEHQLMDR